MSLYFPAATAAISRFAAAFILLAAAVAANAQRVDVNANGMSDIWEWTYNATNAAPTAELDGDGIPNAGEATAGTDPNSAASVPKISPLLLSPTNANITMAAQLGKLYQLQSITNLGSANWLTETSMVVRTGTNFIFPSPKSPALKFYRVVISDVDSDGDGVNDWEEYKLGLDPSNALSNATLDNNGNAMLDWPFVTNRLTQQNVITVTATDPVTYEPDPPPGAATDLGTFTITRAGFALNAITVNFTLATNAGCAKEGVDHVPMARSTTLTAGAISKTLTVTPLANTNLQAPVITLLKLLPGTRYTVGGASNASVVINPSATASGTGLFGQYYTNSNTQFTNFANFNPTNLFLSRVETNLDFTWGGPTQLPNLSNGLYTVRWTGQVQPQYSELYYFDVYSDDGCRLWVNDSLIISNWSSKSASDLIGTINLQAGVRYNLKLEYLQGGGSARMQLNWYSASQSKQVIPNNRLYPTNSYSGGSNAAPIITSALAAFGFLGQPFSFTVTAANSPQKFSATNLPPGLGFNPTNGVISGTPLLAGEFQVPLTASNAVGLSAAAVNLTIFDSGNAVSRDLWTNILGVNIANIPVDTAPNLSLGYGSLDVTNHGDNYGERVRGYFIAPTTGNYYFWIAGSDSAQLWIADDAEPVNKILRCWVTPTNNPTASGQNGTSPRQWSLQSRQRSDWLALVAGQKYYFEVLHKAGVGTNDNWSVAWLQDPTGTNVVPAGVIPSYLHSRYFTPVPVYQTGTLYTANLLALPGVTSSGGGSATMRVSADGSQAIIKFSLNGLSGAHVDHIYTDPYLMNPTTLVFDISDTTPLADGSYLWNIKQSGSLTEADILQAIIEGKASIVIQTPDAYPDGEIGGHFKLANGMQNFIAPTNPPIWTDDSNTTNGAARFLTQATYGASLAEIANVNSTGYSNWINAQMALPITKHLDLVRVNKNPDPSNPWPSSAFFNAWWQNAITAPDQLRQRVAFALSEIVVISENGSLQDHAEALGYYYDLLLTNAFGNFRQLLEDVTLSPGMGVYLNMQANDKGNIVTGTHPNENYAREINQLFSVGLYRLWPDGSLVLNSAGNPVPTYDQNVVNGFSATFTGWNYFQTNQANGRLPTGFSPSSNYTNQMVLVPTRHELGAKLLLNNVTLPPGWGNQTNSSTTNFDLYCSNDLELAHDNIFNHPNVGPFVCRQLIQRLVTSHPSRGYLYRVVQKFNDNGSGVRGDLAAVVKAILLDHEARSPDLLAATTYGKQREPLLRATAMARAFPAPTTQTGTYSETGTQTNYLTLPQPHRVMNGDVVYLTFTDTSGNAAPPNQGYTTTFINSNTFSVVIPNLSSGTYSQNTNVITVNIGSHGLASGNAIYLQFPTGGAASGLYLVVSSNSTSLFTVTTPDAAVRSGNVLLPKISASGFTQSSTNVTAFCAAPHALVTNQTIYVPPNSRNLPAGQYQVVGIPDALTFSLRSTNSTSQTQSSFTFYPLSPPPLVRSGTATIRWSTWSLGYTDTGATYNLSQTPMSANTVFNFFYPDYAFPGALSAAGLTTPEFQLTSDTSVALQINFLASGMITNNSSNPNTNGFSSFTAGDGDIVMDVGPWMTTNFTANANVPALVDNLNSLLLAGQLSATAKTAIVNYVTNTVNLPYGTPPTQMQMRDRVRAVAQLITCSPDYTIQK